MYNNRIDFAALLGKTLTDVKASDESVIFTTTEGEEFLLYHEQDCCERVTVEDIAGDLQDLIGSPILQAEENSNQDEPPIGNHVESFTWTFYRISTMKGQVVIRWYGESNGYYSEKVSFAKTK